MLQNELDMSFNYAPITYGEIKEGVGKRASDKVLQVFENIVRGEKTLENAWNRTHNQGGKHKAMWFTSTVWYEENIPPTIAGDHGTYFDFEEKSQVSNETIRNCSSFPQDYNFMEQKIPYITGMSVPPLMIKRIVTRLIESGVFE